MSLHTHTHTHTHTHNRFGKGVYFADMVSKSANYCFPSKEKNVGLLLLCEVVLGEQHKRLTADTYLHLHMPPGTQSTMGQGRTAPDPKDTLTLDGGLKVPLGPPAPTGVVGSSLEYNEFIVYDTKQIRFRYLLKVKFNFKY